MQATRIFGVNYAKTATLQLMVQKKTQINDANLAVE